MSLRILITPSGFKECLAAEEVASAIAAGIRRVLPDAFIRQAPLADGGEGFTRALIDATGGVLHPVTVTGPVGKAVDAHIGFLGGDGRRIAVLEMAAAAGLRLVPPEARDPLKTTTYGVGELIRAALDAGAQELLVGCGDSGTNDGGAGMAQALGIHLLDAAGREIGRGGAELLRLQRIDLSGRDPRLSTTHIDVACNWHNVLCGPDGVSRIFGPQKGASPQTVQQMQAGMEHYAAVIARDIGINVRLLPGSGASGGLGAGLHALLGATLKPRYEIATQYLDLDGLLRSVDLVITAEGGIDSQTPRGKVPAEVARRAKQHGLPVVALAGTVGQGASLSYDCGIDAFSSILQAPCTLSQAIEQAPVLLADAAESAIRCILIGQKLDKRDRAQPNAKPRRAKGWASRRRLQGGSCHSRR
jgi:glycerate kinase